MRTPKIVTTLKTYSWALFREDAVAGVTVAMVAIPLSLAIAIASGAAPETGLFTAIVGGFLVSLLGGSRVQIGGPTGAFIVVVFGVIADHGYDGLVLATFMAGILLLIAAYFRLGRMVQYVPESVVNGFTIGIAVIIATSQIKDLLGLSLTDVPADFIPKIAAFWAARDSINLPVVAVSLVSIVLIVGLRMKFPKFPGLIVAVVVASAGAVWLDLPVDTIASRFGALPDSLPVPALPEISVPRVLELLPSALVIAFLAGVESLLSAMVADRMIQGAHRPNAELLAQGSANLASSLVGGLPVTGAIARTATNVRAGGKTPVAGLVHAVTVLAVMMLAAPLAGRMAMPALAAILILTAWNMSEPQKWRSYAAAPVGDRLLLLLTLVLTVVIDLTVAIGIGVAVGLVLRRYQGRLQPDKWRIPKR
ncbi:MAG: SulP family inorganic anion transporter [Alphaproteobacteria bacterium]|nr:SulP family inorganic anion transporter [Alphaproteobacteria bacterium]MBO6863690.1 SulP family inorganic anion transporter [Alphaproteobacteria bacterium]